MDKDISLTVIVPALNEEELLTDAVTGIIEVLKKLVRDWEIILINDGSIDRTGEIAGSLAAGQKQIKVLTHNRPMGIGYCFREGVLNSTKDAVTFLPGDGENDPYEIIKYLGLLTHVDFINPFVVNKEVRSKKRRLLSALYLRIINSSFGTNFNYTNGNVIYKRAVFEKVRSESNSFFFQTEYLIKSARAGFIFAEVPIRIRKRLKGESKAISLKSFFVLSWEFFRLFISSRILFRI